MKVLAKVLKTLTEGSKSVNQLVEATGYSRAQIYRALKKLKNLGIVELTRGKVAYTRTPEGLAAKKIALNYARPDLILKQKHLQILTLLSKQPRTVSQLSALTQTPQSTMRRILRQLREAGLIVTKDGTYVLVEDHDLKRLIEVLVQRKLAIQLEPEAIPAYASTKLIIKKVAKGLKVSGTPTAFTLFPKYGLQIKTPWDYYATPPGDQSPEEALVHALLAAETRYERTLAALFYAKNKDKISFDKARRLARGTPALRLLLALPAYVAGQPVETHGEFLPWNEFKELADRYGVRLYPSATLPVIEKYFHQAGRNLVKEVEAYVFGGLNLLVLGVKPSTKDVDLIVEKPEDFCALIKALQLSGYRFLGAAPEGAHVVVLIKDSLRIDLNLSRVHDIKLTPGMKARATKALEYGKLILKLLSPEDVVLLKAAAGRDRDLEDIALTVRKIGIKWRYIIKALEEQCPETAEKYAAQVLESLEVLEDAYSIAIPRKIKARLRKLAYKYFIRQALKLGYKEPTEIAMQTGIPPAEIAKILREIQARNEAT